MDGLTHLLVPLAVAYAVRPELFESPWHLSIGVFGVVPDFDKFLGMQGVMHSPIVLGVIGLALLGVSRRLRGERTYALLATVLLFSHLVLDFIDGGPVLLFYPFVETGFGLLYSSEIVFGEAVWEVAVRDLWPSLRVGGMPDQGPATYGLVNGTGVLSLLAFLAIYLGSKRSDPR